MPVALAVGRSLRSEPDNQPPEIPTNPPIEAPEQNPSQPDITPPSIPEEQPLPDVMPIDPLHLGMD
jgi:hypothetical protein